MGTRKQGMRLLEQPEEINCTRQKLVHGDRKLSGKRETLVQEDLCKRDMSRAGYSGSKGLHDGKRSLDFSWLGKHTERAYIPL